MPGISTTANSSRNHFRLNSHTYPRAGVLPTGPLVIAERSAESSHDVKFSNLDWLSFLRGGSPYPSFKWGTTLFRNHT